MNYAIIHHPSRTINPSIERELDRYNVQNDINNLGCTNRHLLAITEAATNGFPTIIIEDDAILCQGFADKSYEFYSAQCIHNDCDAVSFYLGQGAPTHMQSCFKDAIELADFSHRDAIYMPSLYHAVCYCIKPEIAAEICRKIPVPNRSPMIDELLSMYLHKVAYSWPSLADHDDSQPSIVKHTGARPTIPRVAWRFRG